MTRYALVCGIILLSVGPARAAVRPGGEAQYYLSAAAEGHTPPVKRMRLVALETERVDGRACQWWEMTMEKTDGSGLLAVRVLSREVPLTSTEAPGEIVRYMCRLADGSCFEYRDQRTGRAVLPAIVDWQDKWLPKAARDARYRDGFANSGGLLGHVLVRAALRSDFPEVRFDDVRVLDVRPDLLIGSQAEHHPPPGGEGEAVPWSRQDYETMVAVGANYFRAGGELRGRLLEQPVFVQGTGNHPDDYYRSNLRPGRMFLDEPMVRFDWSPWVPRHLLSPEIAAEAIRIRVEKMEQPQRRTLPAANYPTGWDEFGNMDPLVPGAVSWETHFWSAWYQMAAGVPGIVHEGRYRPRGYDWEPEMLFGDGCERLTDREMFDFFFGFLRGAARAFDGYWGMSIYPESAYDQRLPAVVRAYDMGAKMILFWVHDPIKFDEQVRIIGGLMDHSRAHPRPPNEVTVRGAEVGIVFPAGYAFSWYGTWGKDREEVNDYGVSYGDICAAALWEGILCSRRGIEYDFLVDSPGIERLGYRRLVRVSEDGTVDVQPPWDEDRSPRDLRLSLQARPEQEIAGRADRPAEFAVARAGKMRIDADFGDWAGAEWIGMSGDPYLFADIIETHLTIEVPEGVTPTDDRYYLGYTYQHINDELKEKYLLEGFWDQRGVVVTGVEPDSPAAKAGLREGDVISHMGGRMTRWGSEMWRLIDGWMKQPGRQSIGVSLKRSGLDRFGGPGDLSARIAFGVDDANVYFAAQVTDDVHAQMMDGWGVWRNDSVQIGFDPVLDRSSYGYGENGHEIGLVLKDGEAAAWRWAGRRGQPVGRSPQVKVAIEREGDQTRYEAAIPLSELTPLSPDIWPQCGIDVVVNDSDNGVERKSRLELRVGAMTRGKHPDQFAEFEFAPSADRSKVSAALFWDRRALGPGGRATLTAAVRSPETTRARILARLRSLDEPEAPPAKAEIEIPVGAEPTEWRLSASTASQPGRYRLDLAVVDPRGSVVARDGLPIYIYR